jgi:hypothetical protein
MYIRSRQGRLRRPDAELDAMIRRHVNVAARIEALAEAWKRAVSGCCAALTAVNLIPCTTRKQAAG